MRKDREIPRRVEGCGATAKVESSVEGAAACSPIHDTNVAALDW